VTTDAYLKTKILPSYMFLNVVNPVFKFWWNEELNSLKEASVDSNKLWKAARKPRTGPIY